MRFSRLNTRVSFVHKKNGKDPVSRENIEILETLFSCWAEIREQKLREKLSTVGTIYENSITFIIRYQQIKKVTNNMHVLHHDELYEIKDILPNSQDQDLINVFAEKVS
ncbi:phage head closure protein [Bacillus sp. WMMC1349]|uniref:phage head closure protein n=1 Tax=Bacillus sp. WMMC1349 TaxID=2736254 RepID=UPI00155283C6|nr:phage head closure protein [Bacillus sp. WMMC1349]NPC94795.1 phage head closure protein [Bacillus sp. WMMC1349]NPC94843.1 phage head closure protein [Bacillus sp. WMMC1349]